MAELNMERRFAVMGAAFRLEQLDTERAAILQEFPEVGVMMRKPRLTRAAKLNGVESAARDLWAGREAAKPRRTAAKGKAKRKASRDISEETRERMAKAARKRWKMARAAGVGGGKLPAAKDLAKAAKKAPAAKRTMTPEGRQKIAAARRLRANEVRKRKGLPALPSS